MRFKLWDLLVAVIVFAAAAAAGAAAAAAFTPDTPPPALSGETVSAALSAASDLLPPAAQDWIAIAGAVLAGILTILGGVVAIASVVAPLTRSRADDIWAAKAKALLDRLSVLPLGLFRSRTTGIRPVEKKEV
jgi:hypothetical protein